MSNLQSDEMPNLNIKLSHHEKRSLAFKILVVAIMFMIVMASAGLLYHLISISDAFLSAWFIGIAFIAIAMFGIGYLVRDSLPGRMNARCRRFYYMGREFNIWHWKRSQVFLADIFLVTLGGAIYGWAIANTIPQMLDGFSWYDPTPLLHLPFFYFPLWIEVVVENVLLVLTVIGFLYEAKTWLLGKKSDLCHFEGINNTSGGMVYPCDPDDLDCQLNDEVPL